LRSFECSYFTELLPETNRVELFVGVDSLEWVHIPIQDETAPTVTQIQQFVSLVDKAESEGVVRRLYCQLLRL